MSFRSHVDQQKQEKINKYENVGRQDLQKSQRQNSSIEGSGPMISRNIQKSTYLQDEDLQQKDEVKQQVETQNSNIYTSQYVVSLKKSSFEEKVSQKISVSQGRVQNTTEKQQEEQEYQSISSERSEEEKKQPKANQVKETQNSKHKQAQQINTISAYSSKGELINFENSEILLQKTHTSKNSSAVRFNNELINSQNNSSQPEQNHATFELHSYDNKSSLKSSENITNKQNLKIQTSIQPKSHLTSSYSRLTDKDIKISQHGIRQKKKVEEIKYPSLVLSGSSKKSSDNQRNKEIDFEESINYLKSPRNYALTMKKMTSQESPKRTQSLGLIEEKSHSQKLRHSNEKKSEIKQRTKDIEQKESFKAKQGSNLFYVSISNQEMYPSLDLKQNTQKIITFRDIKSSVVQQNEFNQIEAKRQASLQRKPQQKTNYQPGLPCRIKILEYHSQFFLKIETQIFSIRVEYPPDQRNIQLKNLNKNQKQMNVVNQSVETYEIERRFSDFVFLYEGIMTNHLGYIIYPFPQKSFESFVRIKLQSIIGATVSDGTTNYEAEKMQLIEKRIEELQQFVNFLISHEQLRYSQQLAIFLCHDSQLYQRSRQRIEKYIEEYKQLQTSGNLIQEGKKNIKKAFETGFDMVMKWWGSSPDDKQDMNQRIQKSRQSRQLSVGSSMSELDQEFLTYSQTLAICFAKFDLLQRSLIKLLETHNNLLEFRDMDTEFDYLIKLSAKVSSGKQYSRKLTQVIEVELIQEISRGRRWLQQSRSQIQKRQQLKQLIESLKQSLSYTNDASSKISKLERRLERFEKNFRFSFGSLVTQSERMFEQSKEKFVEEWKQHKTNMSKIWK